MKLSGLKFFIYEHRKNLWELCPSFSGIYILLVIDEKTMTRRFKYIGSSYNFRCRMSMHTTMRDVSKSIYGEEKLYVLFYRTHPSLRGYFEKWFINRYQPELNRHKFKKASELINLVKITKLNKKKLQKRPYATGLAKCETDTYGNVLVRGIGTEKIITTK